MRTNQLIQYNIFKNSYKVDSKRLGVFFQEASTILGIRNQRLYYNAYKEYKKYPWIYDMEGGDIVLATKVLFNSFEYSRINITNLLFYRIIRSLCFNNYGGENLDVWAQYEWVAYPKMLEDAYVKAYSKVINMGYFKSDSLFVDHDGSVLKHLLEDFIKFFYFATWQIDHQDSETIGWWTKVLHRIFLQDVEDTYEVQAVNIVNRYLQDLAQLEEYQNDHITYYSF